MKRWQVVVTGLAAYGFWLVMIAPASLLDAGLQLASEGKLRLVEAQGSVWLGTGQIEIRDAEGRSDVAQSVAWQILPGSLLTGHIAYRVRLAQAAAFPVTLAWSGITLERAEISLPATALGVLSPKLVALGLTGDLALHIPYLAVGRNTIQGNATLAWHDAGSVLTRIAPLGNYELNYSAAEGGVNVLLRTLQGPLLLEGKGNWANGARPGLLVMAQVPPQYQQQLDPLLRLIAVERGAGSFALQLK